MLRGQQEQEEEGEVGRRVADELDEGLPDEQAQRALWGDQVAHGEDREQEPDDEARHHLHGPVSPPPARELVVPARGQQLLAVGLGHELDGKEKGKGVRVARNNSRSLVPSAASAVPGVRHCAFRQSRRA